MKHEGQVTLFSRNRKRFNSRFPSIAAAFARPPDETIVDGEIVALDESGRPSFSRLQNFSANANAITFYAFDIPMWKGGICGHGRSTSVASCCARKRCRNCPPFISPKVLPPTLKR